MSDISTWRGVASQNNLTAPDGAPEGMTPASVNNVIREVMAAVSRWYQEPEWIDINEGGAISKEDDDEVRITGIDVTGAYLPNRRLRIIGTGTPKGFVVSALVDAGDTVVTVLLDESGVVPADISEFQLYHSTELAGSAFVGSSILESEFFLYP